MINTIIDGDYKNYYVNLDKYTSNLSISSSNSFIELSTQTIKNIDIKYIEYKKNLFDIMARIILFYSILGYIGILAGFTASSNVFSYTILIEFHDGKKSLIRLDKKFFKILSNTIY